MAETKKTRVSRVIRSLMHELGFTSVSAFAEHLGCNYMQLYYCYSGHNNEISSELFKKITFNYPNVRTDFLLHGDLPIFKSANTEVKERESFELDTDAVSPIDMMKLLDRITTLLEKVQDREDRLEKKIERLEELEAKLTERLNDGNNAQFKAS